MVRSTYGLRFSRDPAHARMPFESNFDSPPKALSSPTAKCESSKPGAPAILHSILGGAFKAFEK